MPSPPLTPRRGLAIAAIAMVLLFTMAAAAQSLGSFISPGELARPHADLDTLGGCLQCHEPGGEGESATLCMDCHDSVRGQVNGNKGFHATLGDDCSSCHSDHNGLDFELIKMEKSTFQHHKTGFALVGEHVAVECGECHEDEPDWTGLRSTCLPCHAEDDGHRPEGGGHEALGACQSCHDVDPDWSALPLSTDVFDHSDSAQADYALVGKHEKVDCIECHTKDLHFVPVESEECTDCHKDPHDAELDDDCESCHETPHTWEVEGFDHALTGYPLKGQHRSVRCTSCHAEDKTSPVPHARCESCHRDPHRGEFKPRDCDACHDVNLPLASMDFDHDQTDYPLVGHHQDVSCTECHGEGDEQTFKGLTWGTCDDCHDDAHVGFFDEQGCESCHEPVRAFDEVPDFDHGLTGYALEGEHKSAECEACHDPGTGPELPHASCQDCHGYDSPHNETVTAESCDDCHTVVSFTDITFDHGTTEFPLERGHEPVGCADCHSPDDGKLEQFEGTPSICAECHEEDRPERHFEGACGQCHQATTWPVATLGELGHGVTGFALEGAHTALECVDCHSTERPEQRVGSTCSSCHANDDAHRGMMGDDCSSCHMETSWYRTRWTHAQTGYTLTGSHRLAACQDCHATGTVGTPTTCQQCHEKVQPNDDIHTPSFADHCDDCHKTYGWETPLFPH